VIESIYDEVVTPYGSAFLNGSNVTNITLQQQCPFDFGEHLSMPYDHIADADVLTALDPVPPLTPACCHGSATRGSAASPWQSPPAHGVARAPCFTWRLH